MTTTAKRHPGRPKIHGPGVEIRAKLPPDTVAALEAWAREAAPAAKTVRARLIAAVEALRAR